MKKIFAFILPLFLFLACSKPQEAKNADENTQKAGGNKKAGIIFFSKTGENYGVGNVKIGNTHKVAMEIARQTNGTLFEIEPVKEYPIGYKECVEVAKKEKASKARPAIKGKMDNIAQYDIIYLGYPNWGNDAPMVVYTFLESYDLKGKQIYPFVTHEGSGIGNSVNALKGTFPDLIFNEGFEIFGHIAQKDAPYLAKAVKIWLDK